MTYMTDTGRVATFLNFALSSGSIMTITGPYFLRLMTTAATGNGNVNGTNGTEATSGTCPGYTAGGSTLGASNPFGSLPFSSTAPTASNANAVTWSATGTWSSIPAIEIWDSTTGTKLRWFQGLLTASITGVVNGDTVSFAIGSISLNATGW
jgi:hypothetical protein